MVSSRWLVALPAVVAAIAQAPAAAQSQKPFELQVVVDIYDDVLAAPFSEKALDEMMRIFKSWGITRVYWNGQAYASGLYDGNTAPNLDTNALATYQNIGEFIPVAAKAAHAHGLEFLIEFKPYDMYFPMLSPHDISLFKVRNPWRNGIPAVGGSWQMGSIWPEQHPEYLIARNMTGIRPGIEKEPTGTIKFAKEDDGPTGITRDNLELYVSADNHHYRLYDKPYQYDDRVEERPVMVRGVNLHRPGEGTERVRVITLSGLDIPERYVAISTKGKQGPPDFGNLYWKLVEMYTVAGEPMPFTYGFHSPFAEAWWSPELLASRFPDRGFMFDMGPDWNSNLVDYCGNTRGFLDSEERLIGLGKGKNPYLTALSPAYPEVRQYWMDQIEQFIDWGADGVEFRWYAHQITTEVDAYGFNTPVVEAYKKRYGADILTEEFDRGKWRKLQGDYYTRFLRDAKKLLASRGKTMMVDVVPQNNADPAAPQFLNIHLDWQRWFSFADGVCFKWVGPGEADARFRPVADKYGIPTYYNTWPEVLYQNMTPEQIVENLKLLRATGHRGFILYEAAGFVRAKADGTFDVAYPTIPDVIVPAVKAMNSEP